MHGTNKVIYIGGYEMVTFKVIATNNDGMESDVAEKTITTPVLGTFQATMM